MLSNSKLEKLQLAIGKCFAKAHLNAEDIEVILEASDDEFSVNMGLNQAGKLIQRACNQYGKTLTEDGKLGPKSILAINQINPEELIVAVRSHSVGEKISVTYKRAGVSKTISLTLAASK